jgi:hypothetical protein
MREIDIRITPAVQVIALLAFILAGVGVIVGGLPELRRYLNIKTM